VRILLLSMFALAGCPPADKAEPAPRQSDACSSVGQRCEVSPGKLGTCVMKDGCTEATAACFDCQSQH
jgi:hypothetical protein